MAKQQNHKSSACKLQINSEFKALTTQQTENQKVRDDNLNALCELRQKKTSNKLLIGKLNITSISSKFDQTKCITATQFLIDGYSKPFRFDRNRNAVGILSYVREV